MLLLVPSISVYPFKQQPDRIPEAQSFQNSVIFKCMGGLKMNGQLHVPVICICEKVLVFFSDTYLTGSAYKDNFTYLPCIISVLTSQPVSSVIIHFIIKRVKYHYFKKFQVCLFPYLLPNLFFVTTVF